MGIFSKQRGGTGSNHHSGRMDYPYAGDGRPKATSAPSAPQAAAPAPSPAMRYNVEGGGGDYLLTTPRGDDKYDVSRYGSDHSLKYNTEGAYFGRDEKTGMASWSGGKDMGGLGGKGNIKVSSGYDTSKG